MENSATIESKKMPLKVVAKPSILDELFENDLATPLLIIKICNRTKTFEGNDL